MTSSSQIAARLLEDEEDFDPKKMVLRMLSCEGVLDSYGFEPVHGYAGTFEKDYKAGPNAGVHVEVTVHKTNPSLSPKAMFHGRTTVYKQGLVRANLPFAWYRYGVNEAELVPMLDAALKAIEKTVADSMEDYPSDLRGWAEMLKSELVDNLHFIVNVTSATRRAQWD